MIIWIASYPKAGNTWLRVILSQLFYKENRNEIDVFKNLDKFPTYPKHEHFKGLSKDFDKPEGFTNLNVIKNWILSQEKMNLDKKLKFLKTHNYACKLNISDKENFSFTDVKNTLGVIYIVRDPRNLITSLKYQFSLDTYEETLEMMSDENKWIGKISAVPQILSSWDNHFKSWSRFPNNFLLIKYEDLLNNTKNEIKNLVNYLNKFQKLNIDDFDIDQIIKNSHFSNLKKQESLQGFKERVPDKKTNKKKTFFNLGPENNWKNILDKEIVDKIEFRFESTMKELGYI